MARKGMVISQLCGGEKWTHSGYVQHHKQCDCIWAVKEVKSRMIPRLYLSSGVKSGSIY